MEIKQLPEITIIGKVGLCTKGNNIVSSLWKDANDHFQEIAKLGKKDETNCYAGFWGAMSDINMHFLPWEDDFSTGYYLAGLESIYDSPVPKGWTKWVLPARKYIIEEVDPTNYQKVFHDTIFHTIPSLNLKLIGAICDYTNPKTNKNYLYFPVK